MVSIRVKVIVPKVQFKDKRWVEEIADTLKNKAAPTLKTLFRGTTFGWSHHPSFRQKLIRRASSLSMEVYTEDDIYRLVNEGSPPHYIPKSGTTFMSFRPGYKAATRPGSLVSGRAYRSGKQVGAYRISRDKPHPGFEPRVFDEQVARAYEPILKRDVQAALKRATG